jgi:phenylalanyl-tRNA synthetase beta chain
MKLSFNWLQELVDLKGLSAEEVGKNLTLHTAELEGIEEGDGDTLFDIDNKSLTHRPDLWGHIGFARELGAIFGRKSKLKNPKVKFPSKGNAPVVKIETDKCRRFCALRMSGIKIGLSDVTTQKLIENLGTRSISNMVDITNSVLFCMGQPMHVFDASKVEGNIVVRQARQGEKLLTLDELEYELCPDDIVIADEKKVLSIAGIMGGMESSVTAKTTDIIFEAANFDPVSIRKTSHRLGLRSESSIRYEKSIDPQMCSEAMTMAAELALRSNEKGKIEGPITDQYPIKAKPLVIELDTNHVRSLSGLAIPDAEIKAKLESIAFGVKKSKQGFSVSVPSFRSTKDVAIAEDLIEEIVRLYGFENIEADLPHLAITPPRVNHVRNLEWKLRDFSETRNFMEVYNYSFADTFDLKFTGEDNFVSVANPLSENQTHLRTTLISPMVKNIESELRTHGKLNLFEIGKTYIKTSDTLPVEESHLTLMLAEVGGKENDLFFALKEELLQLFQSLKITGEFREAKAPSAYAHPSKAAEVWVGDDHIGEISVLHPSVHPVRNSAFAFAEINLPKLLACTQKTAVQYEKISSFPSVFLDVSLVMDKRTAMTDLVNVMKESSALLRNVELFDEFTDEAKLGKGFKNLAFHLEFQSASGTIEESELKKQFDKITENLSSKWSAKLRAAFDKEASSVV